MSDDETPEVDDPDVPIEEVAPEPDEPEEVVQLVRTGWVRFLWADRRLRLRRPYFGEIKQLRLSLEDVTDSIVTHSEEVQVRALEMADREREIAEDETMSNAERFGARTALKTESKRLSRELTVRSEEMRLGWWAEVFDVLAVDSAEVPETDQLPGWIVDVSLPQRILNHWRSAPLGRG